MTKPKPCPFCGSSEGYINHEYTECGDCGESALTETWEALPQALPMHKRTCDACVKNTDGSFCSTAAKKANKQFKNCTGWSDNPDEAPKGNEPWREPEGAKHPGTRSVKVPPQGCYKCGSDYTMTPICTNCSTIPIAQDEIERLQQRVAELEGTVRSLGVCPYCGAAIDPKCGCQCEK